MFLNPRRAGSGLFVAFADQSGRRRFAGSLKAGVRSAVLLIVRSWQDIQMRTRELQKEDTAPEEEEQEHIIPSGLFALPPSGSASRGRSGAGAGGPLGRNASLLLSPGTPVQLMRSLTGESKSAGGSALGLSLKLPLPQALARASSLSSIVSSPAPAACKFGAAPSAFLT